MKRTHLLAAVIATAIPFATVLAEDTTGAVRLYNLGYPKLWDLLTADRSKN